MVASTACWSSPQSPPKPVGGAQQHRATPTARRRAGGINRRHRHSEEHANARAALGARSRLGAIKSGWAGGREQTEHACSPGSFPWLFVNVGDGNRSRGHPHNLDGFSHVTPCLCCKRSHIPPNLETALRRFRRSGKAPAFVVMALPYPPSIVG